MTTHTVDELLQLAHLNGAACHDIGFHGALKNKAEVRRLELEAGKIQRELRTALTEALAQKWLPIDDSAKGRSVLIAYRNQLGKWRRVRAKFFAVGTLELDEDDPRYDHDADENFAPGGWYELCENAEVINFVDGTPELWCELPPLPQPP